MNIFINLLILSLYVKILILKVFKVNVPNSQATVIFSKFSTCGVHVSPNLFLFLYLEVLGLAKTAKGTKVALMFPSAETEKATHLARQMMLRHWDLQMYNTLYKVSCCFVHCLKGDLSIYTNFITPSISLDSPFKIKAYSKTGCWMRI